MEPRVFLAAATITVLTVATFAALAGDAGLGAALAALLAGFAGAAVLGRVLRAPLRRAAETAQELARGSRRRLPETIGGDLGDLYRALNRLGEELEQRLGEIRADSAETETLLREMSEGVLAVTADGTVARANASLRRMLGAAQPLEGRGLGTVFRDPELVRFLTPDRSPGGKQGEFEAFGRTVLVSTRPLPGGGRVAVFSDLTSLRRLERVRTDFVANASHELKTPLTAIRGFAETLVDPSVPDEDARDFGRRIVEQATRMSAIIEDLLTLARLEAPERPVQRDTLRLRSVAEQAWRQVSERPGGSSVEFSVEIEPPDLAVLADPVGVAQILENLIDNAIRHAEAAAVGVQAAPRPGGTVELTVWDDGRGIPSAHVDRVFERFYRVDPSRSRASGGTGLGLSIVKHWAESMGGRVWIESRIGGGTKIHVALPAAATSVER